MKIHEPLRANISLLDPNIAQTVHRLKAEVLRQLRKRTGLSSRDLRQKVKWLEAEGPGGRLLIGEVEV